MNTLLRCWVALAATAVVRAALSACPDRSKSDYDFIVVGSGVGGGPLAARLAESGYSVLVVDAGHEVLSVNTTIPAYSFRSLDDPQVNLNYSIQEYPAGFHTQRESWYPRARALGGSTVSNTMVNSVAGMQKDFDDLASMFNDSSWSRTNMQQYYKRIEKNLDAGASTADHGIDGWLKTRSLPLDVFFSHPSFFDLQIASVVASLGLSTSMIPDLNSLASDGAAGGTIPSSTIDENHLRSTVGSRLSAVAKSSKNLKLATDTLATKVLLCGSGKPTAYGVQIAPGAALAVSGVFKGKQQLYVKNVTAKYEVIVSAGAFQSPQLLMLSGIGDKDHLKENGVEPIVHLPGVGSNLQDHDEISTVWNMKNEYSLFKGCKFLSDPKKDACLDYWNKNKGENLYAFNGPIFATLAKSSANLTTPDTFTYIIPGYFPGFFRGVAQEFADHGGALTAVTLLAHPSTKGTVRLTGPHPQDYLDIQKLHFQDPVNGPKDVAIMREGIKRARSVVTGSLMNLAVDHELLPGENVKTDAEIDNYVYERIFGHHACCTNPMGADSDPNAVLDGNFNVKGVNGLRVVDISSWSQVPGWFVTTPTYMISEKAADVIIAATETKGDQ